VLCLRLSSSRVHRSCHGYKKKDDTTRYDIIPHHNINVYPRPFVLNPFVFFAKCVRVVYSRASFCARAVTFFSAHCSRSYNIQGANVLPNTRRPLTYVTSEISDVAIEMYKKKYVSDEVARNAGPSTRDY